MKKSILFIWVLCLGVFSQAFAQSAKKLHKEALGAYLRSEYNISLDLLNQAYTLEPENEDVLLLRGRTFLRLNKANEAIGDLSKAATIAPKNTDIFENLSEAHTMNGDFAQAISALDSYLKIRPKQISIHRQKANLQLLKKDFAEAVKTCNTAIALEKEDDSIHFLLAVATDSLGNDLAAENYYKNAIELALADKSRRAMTDLMSSYYAGIAGSQANLHKHDQAIKNYSEAIKFSQNNANLFLKRGLSFVAQTELQNGLQDFTQAIGLDAKNYSAFYNRGLINKKLGQFPAAISDFNQAIKIQPNSAASIFGRGNCYEANNSLNDAVRDYKKALDLDPKNQEYSRQFVVAREKLYEANKEEIAPIVKITSPTGITNEIIVKANQDNLQLEGIILDASAIKSLLIDGRPLDVNAEELNPSFTTTLSIKGKSTIEIKAYDVYLNVGTLKINIIRNETNAPEITITKPFETINKTIFLDGSSSLYLEGKISDESRIKSILINGMSATFLVDELNPKFQATVNTEKLESLVVTAIDVLGNEKIATYKLVNEDSSTSNKMGRTWVVIIDNSNYSLLPKLPTENSDLEEIKSTLSKYQIEHFVAKKDLTKKEMEKFFTIELRDLVQNNRVKSLMIWYSGQAQLINENGYWMPIDAAVGDEFSYYSVNNLRSSLEGYLDLKHVLVLSDAADVGQLFSSSTAEKTTAIDSEKGELAQTKSAQVFVVSSKEMAAENKLFTQSFTNILNNNQSNCISIELLSEKVNNMLIQNKKASAKLGRIKGITEEKGSFIFYKKI
jgi:tetratricopeptide (TPR) repeat protein